MKEWLITDSNKGQRIDKFVLKMLPVMTKSFCYKMFRKKNITLNKKKISGSEILNDGDVIRVFFSDETYAKFSNSNIKRVDNDIFHLKDSNIIYEDEQLLVVNKEPGWLSQGAEGEASLIDAIKLYYCEQQIQLAFGVPVSVSNRLDKNTSGIVFSGKTLPVIQSLNDAIASHQSKKVYLTVVSGQLRDSRVIEGYIHKDKKSNTVSFYPLDDKYKNNKDYDYIYTSIRPILLGNAYTELEVCIKTGKSHQIRISLASIGHPIVGDTKYGNKDVNLIVKEKYGLKHQLLHAWQYQLVNAQGILKQYSKAFIAPIPAGYLEIRNGLLKDG